MPRNHKNRYLSLLIPIIIILLAASCQKDNQLPEPMQMETSLHEESITASPTNTSLPSPEPTEASSHTNTPEPTATPSHTNTLVPTIEPTMASFATEPLTLVTEDGVILAGHLTLPEPETDKQIGLILAHEVDSNHHVWDAMVSDFASMGFTVLAFDFRGHGESSGGKD